MKLLKEGSKQVPNELPTVCRSNLKKMFPNSKKDWQRNCLIFIGFFRRNSHSRILKFPSTRIFWTGCQKIPSRKKFLTEFRKTYMKHVRIPTMLLVLLLEWYTENMPEKNNCVNSKRIAEEIFKKMRKSSQRYCWVVCWKGCGVNFRI